MTAKRNEHLFLWKKIQDSEAIQKKHKFKRTGLPRAKALAVTISRHCEERNDEAIQ